MDGAPFLIEPPNSQSNSSGASSRPSNTNILKIHIDNCRSDVFIILLEYIYVGIVDIGPKEAFDLLKVADEYKLASPQKQMREHHLSVCQRRERRSSLQAGIYRRFTIDSMHIHLFTLTIHSLS